MTKLLQKLSKPQAALLERLDEMFENMIENIRKKRGECRDKIYFNYLEEKEMQILRTIFLGSKECELSGDEAKDLFRRLKHINFEAENLSKDLILSL